MAETPWTPEMPLRADATDEQIRMRAHWLWVDAGAPAHGAPYIPIAAREFAAACVAAEREPSPGIRGALEASQGGYTGEPCVNCGRIRVDAKTLTCEKCEVHQCEDAIANRRAAALPAAGVSEDTARLDWIESHGAAVQGPTELNPGLWCVLIEPPNRRVRAVCEERSTLRETIDAARAARRPAPSEGTNGTR